uniref:Secreted protein n=1 Tax=Ascaris lumbricoides TaxID=6252 RepID=A0A0M3HMP2_ASCLU
MITGMSAWGLALGVFTVMIMSLMTIQIISGEGGCSNPFIPGVLTPRKAQRGIPRKPDLRNFLRGLKQKRLSDVAFRADHALATTPWVDTFAVFSRRRR